MTYCLGIAVDEGLLFASDSRTNAGVDYVTTYSKMHSFQPAPDRVFVILSAGNLATTQEVINHIYRDLEYPGGEGNLLTARYLFEAAEYLGRLSQKVQAAHAQALSHSGISGDVTLILGGQIQNQPHGLLMIYPQGNYLSASQETPYLQIGESKYGKPSLDRIARSDMSLTDAGRLALVSLDATSRSNITVGPPFELSFYRRDTLSVTEKYRYEREDPFLMHLREEWNQGIVRAFQHLPRFPWENGAS